MDSRYRKRREINLRYRKRNKPLSIHSQQRLDKLRSLVAGLSRATDIKLEVGRNWAWNFKNRIVYVPEKDLDDIVRCRAITSHEVGHVLYTRHLTWSEIPPDQEQGCPALLHLMINAMEDPRVEMGVGECYPGAAAWLHALHEEEVCLDEGLLMYYPTPFLFFQAHLREYHLNWNALSRADSTLPQVVVTALEETRSIRKRIAMLLPSTITEIGEGLQEAYRREVEYRKQGSFPGRATELKTNLAMARVLDLIETSIRPWILQLYAFDLQRLERIVSLQDIEIVETMLKNNNINSILKQAFSQYTEEMNIPEHLISSITRRIMEAWYQNLCTRSNANYKEACQRSEIGYTEQHSTQNLERTYSKLRQEVYLHIQKLSQELADVLRPRKRQGWKDGYTSGAQVNIRRMLQCEARNTGDINFWKRKTAENKRNAAAMLLIDLSGSMSGNKSVAAVQGAILFVEALLPLGVPVSIMGFQKKLIPVLDFYAPLTKESRKSIVNMLNCVGSINNDAKALKNATEELLAIPTDDHVLIVISDGEPVGKNGPKRLKEEIAKIKGRLHLIGLGLGPKTKHVELYYPQGKGNIPIEFLAREIGWVLQASFRQFR